MKELYAAEIKQDRERWGTPLKSWEQQVQKMERKFYQRRKIIRPMLQKLLQIDKKTLDRDFPKDQSNAQK